MLILISWTKICTFSVQIYFLNQNKSTRGEKSDLDPLDKVIIVSFNFKSNSICRYFLNIDLFYFLDFAFYKP